MTKKQTGVITTLTIAAIILALLVSSRFWLRLDLTRNKAYTISNVSRNLYRELPEPVSITYYISDRLKNIIPAPGEIEDTLREYAAYSRGKITFTVRDPSKLGFFMNAEDLGLQPRQIQVIEQNQESFATVFSGIVIEYLDKTEVLPWVISTSTLEYDITSRIRSMVMNNERTVGVIVGDSHRQWAEHFSSLDITLSEAGYKIHLMYPGEEIPDNLPALFVLGGAEELDDRALYRIDRYIQMGGKVLFAVQSIYVDTIYYTMEARRIQDQGLLDMIASYGIIVRPELVLDISARDMLYQNISRGGTVQYRFIRYPLWVGVLEEYVNAEHPVNADLYGIDLFWPSPLELTGAYGIETTVLFSSTPEAWLMRENFYTNPEIPYLMEFEAEETKGTKILGVSLSGVFRSFFRGAEKPFREGFEEELPDMPPEARHSRIIVVGDTDFTTDIINATNAVHNMEFLLRAADWLVNDDDVISIRNRQPQAGRLDRIADSAKRDAAMSFSQILNVIIVPLLVIITGFVFAFLRRSRSRYAEAKSAKEKSDDI